MATSGERFQNLVDILKRLRDPQGGCPWDLEQSHESIRPYLIEEAYEVLEAIDAADDPELCAELGDLLLQVVFHSQIARDRNAFTIDDVIAGISEKMVRRHPHVFGEEKVGGSADVLRNWEKIKLSERKEKEPDTGKRASVLDGVPAALPALLRAQRLGEKAAKVKFDWRTIEGVIAKVREEANELAEEIRLAGAVKDRPPERTAALAHELGDVLFSLCQLSRWLGLSAEDCLRECCTRFTGRFQTMENDLHRPLNELSDEELEAAWQSAKKKVGH